ncbi:hypothetical protein DV736_g5665, partial [Chaetothyriales sp. CBS 134916]
MKQLANRVQSLYPRPHIPAQDFPLDDYIAIDETFESVAAHSLSTMPMILVDKDLPKLLNTPVKKVKWTKLVAEHLGSTAKRIDKSPMQGVFSRNLFVSLADGGEVVVQFHT